MKLLICDLPDDAELPFAIGRALRQAMPATPFSIRGEAGTVVYDRNDPEAERRAARAAIVTYFGGEGEIETDAPHDSFLDNVPGARRAYEAGVLTGPTPRGEKLVYRIEAA